jgi:Mn2+/Fe2+ NRAMP family transporter
LPEILDPSTKDPSTTAPRFALAVIGPGLLVAATGVGAGDLATAAFAGGILGVAVLWAVPCGALLKFAINEGLARWQLATGQTILEGAVHHFGRVVALGFLAYLLLWSFFVGAALVSACGVTAGSFVPAWSTTNGHIALAITHSLVGLVLVWVGGFKLFQRVMGVCVGIMLLVVLVTAGLLMPDAGVVGAGLFRPSIPDTAGGVDWTLAVIGGVGGTVTVLCYGYWIRETGRTKREDLRVCRIDLGVGYAVTALFGIAMVIIGSTVVVSGSGADLIVSLGARLEERVGSHGRWLFLVGAWSAVFSSLLGVWQAVPYLFADAVRLLKRSGAEVSTRSRAYRGYLIALATVPTLGLFMSFRQLQKTYAVVGALFVPLLALALLAMNDRTAWVGKDLRNGWVARIALLLVLVFFVYLGLRKL